jgi:hypothetical protein
MSIQFLLRGLICLIFFTPIYAQQKDTSVESDDLYAKAVSASADEMEKSWGSFNDNGDKSQIHTDYRHLIVEKDEITETLPKQFGTHEIEYLDSHELSDRYQRLRKEFAVLRVHPMRYNGGHLKIFIGISWFKAKKKHLFYAFSDWSEVEFQYNCEKQNWEITSVKLGGI